MSEAIGAKVEIKKLKIGFFDYVELEGFYVEDLHKDTLLYVEQLQANFDDVYLNATHFDFDRVLLKNGQFNVRQFWNEDDLNIQFLLDILDPPRQPGDTSHSVPPELFFWRTDVENVDFTYEYRDTIPDTGFGMNYDHIRIRDIHARIDRFLIINDSLSGEIRNFRCYEPAGIAIQQLNADFIVSYTTIELANMKLKTPKSSLEGKVRFDYSSYDDLAEFIDSVQIRGKIKKSKVNLDEIAVFAEELRGLNLDVQLSGNVVGTIDNLRGRGISLEMGQHTRLNGNFQFQGLPDIDSTFFNFQLKELRTSAEDLRSIPAYPFHLGDSLDIPNEIDKLGLITYRGKLTGTLDNVSAEGHWFTDPGELVADVNLRFDPDIADYRYEGFLSTPGFNVNALIPTKPAVGVVVGDAVIQGEHFDPNLLIASLDGSIQSINLAGYGYRNLKFVGEVAKNVYNGNLQVNDPNLILSFQGLADFSRLNSRFDFSASLDKMNLTALKLIDRDSAFVVSTEVVSNFTGNSIDNIFGQIELSNTLFRYGTQRYRMEDLLLEASGNPYDRLISLTSDMADVQVEGAFRLASMPGAISDVLNSFLPSFTLIDRSGDPDPFHQNFRYSATIKDISLLEELFFPDLSFRKTTTVNGRFDSALRLLNAKVDAPEFNAYGITFNQLKTIAVAENNQLVVDATVPVVNITDSVLIRHVHLSSNAITDNLGLSVEWASRQDLQSADAQLNANALFQGESIKMRILPSILLVGDSLWQVNEENSISYINGKLDIDNLSFLHNTEFVRVDGVLSDNPEDEIDVVLDNFQLSNLNPFIAESDLSLGGTADGIITMSDVSRQMLFTSNLDLKGIKVNNDLIGDGLLISEWEPDGKKVLLEGFLGTPEFRKIAFNGHFTPSKKENNLDFDVAIRNLRLELIKPYVQDLFSQVSGLLDGDLHISGSPSKPVVDGELSFDKRTFLTVDLLNTRYQLLDKVFFRKNIIYSKSLKIRDARQSLANCELLVKHNYFKDFELDILINANNLQALNTVEGQSDLFFGTAYATGTFRAHGKLDNIKMDISAKTEKGTVFNLPLSGTSDVSQQDFIVFEKAGSGNTDVKKAKRKAESKGYELNFNLEITPEAEARLLFDPKVGDVISGNGSANLQLEVTEAGEFNMYGDYFIEKGEYLFTLQNIINKKFVVRKGGKIQFRGDPYDADIDLAALYKVRTSLYPLVRNIDSSAAVRRPIDVDAIMYLSDKLMKPSVRFDIQLPNADDQMRNLLKSQIVSEDDLNRQVFSLVLFRTFLPSFQGATDIGNVSSNGFELVSSQLSNMLSQFSKDINIGVNYNQGDGNTGDQVNVNLSTQLFNDRVSIDGSVGTMGGTAAANATSNTTNMVGEFNIEVKVTEDGAIRIKVFNRSNQYLLVTNDVPYTQGVGVFYRREFDTFEEILPGKRKTKANR